MPEKTKHPRYSDEQGRILTPYEWAITGQDNKPPDPDDTAIETIKLQIADLADRLDRTPNAAKSRGGAKPSL